MEVKPWHQYLEKKGYLFKNKKKNIPIQEYVDKGFFVLEAILLKQQNRTVTNLKITPRGLNHIALLFKEKPQHPQLFN